MSAPKLPSAKSPATKPLAKRLLAWRAAKGFGRQEGAEELGISKRTLQNWEQERRTNPYYNSVAPVLRRLERDGF